MIRRLALVLLLVVASARASAAAQQVQPGTVSGVVVSTDAQPQPITRAIVTLTGGNITDNISAITDPSGRFRFLNLAPGRYSISVTKVAYLPTRYGATRPGRPGTSIALAAGQQVDVRIGLSRGAVITGTVRDEIGQPASGIEVTVSQALLVTSASGSLPSAGVMTTDDRGVYRAFGLMPGEYIVSALPRTSAGEITAPTRAQFDARLRGLEMRPSGSQRAADEPARLGFAPTFHPGTTMAGNAARIRVGADEERAGVDIALVPVRAARISGTIQGSDIPQRLRPILTAMGPPRPRVFTPTLIGPQADGSFTFSNVTPGRYTLLVRAGQGALVTFDDGRNGATTVNPGLAPAFAMIDLDVDGNDISGVNLTLRPAFSMSGRVEFQGQTKPPNPAAIRISLAPSSPAGSTAVLNAFGAGQLPVAPARADGTFQIEGIVPGTYAVTASLAGWRPRSVMVNGRDVLDEPLQIDGGSTDITDAVVTFIDVRSELAGTLTTASGQPASEFTVLVFPAERSYWRPGARRIKTVRPASDGAFGIMDLPAGDYLLAALTDVDPSDLQQASFLEQIVGAAVKITITDGQKTRQDLRIAR